MVALSGEAQPNPANRAFSPSARVPCLHDGDMVVWDSLAIAEYLAERHPGMWPADPAARAWARSVAREMHSGFSALRNEMTMCIRERVDVRPWSPALAADIARVDRASGTKARQRFGGGGRVPVRRVLARRLLLRAGRVSLSDLRRRARRRGRRLSARLLAHPFMREWEEAALAETAIIEADEPRVIYRDKLAAADAPVRSRRMTTRSSATGRQRIRAAAASTAPLRIRGGGTKDFYGQALAGDVLDTRALRRHRRLRSDRARDHRARRHAARRDRGGDARARADARVRAAALRCAATRRRRSAAASPRACRGRAAPYAGAVRDLVLGVRIVDGTGDDLTFGGRVMKNVAGFDVSRLMTGALGTLGVLIEISLKCLPRPKTRGDARVRMHGRRGDPAGQRMGRPAAAGVGDVLSRRAAVGAAVGRAGRRSRRRSPKIGGDALSMRSGDAFWRERARPDASVFRARRRAAARRCGGCRSSRRRRTPISPATADRVGRRAALARRQRPQRSACDAARLGAQPRRPCDAVSRRRQERRRVPSAARGDARRCTAG